MSRADDYDDYPRRRTPTQTSGKAIASLVLGILSVCVPVLPAIPALILAILGLRDISQSRGRLTGKGLAIAGMVIGALGSLCGLTVYGGGWAIYMRGRESVGRVQSHNDLRQIGLALHEYHDLYGTFPPSAVRRNPSEPAHSWRVAILPFVEQQQLYNRYNFKEPWDSPGNRAILESMPKVFAPPKGTDAPPNTTCYQMFVGKGTVGEGNPDQKGRGLTLGQISMADGTPNTLLVAEAAETVPWTKPEDLPYAADRPLPRLGGHFRNGFLGLFADGTVRTVGNDNPEQTIRNLITYNDGQVITDLR
jgi:hypothetical protein